MIHRILARWQAWRDARRWILMATYTVHYINHSDSTGGKITNSITWMLWERPGGDRRSELCEKAFPAVFASGKFCAPVRIWEAGGSIPEGADVRFTRTKPGVMA